MTALPPVIAQRGNPGSAKSVVKERIKMPILSMFYGILVYMYAYDNRKHHRPHVHVEYAEHTAVVAIDDGEVLEGDLPRAKMKLVQAWLEIHRDELAADWTLSVQGLPPQKIKPLE